MKLYELAAEYQELVRLAEAGDEADAQVFADTLEGMGGMIEQRVDSLCATYKTIVAERDALMTEKKRIDARAGSLSNSADRLKKYLQDAMLVAGLKKVKGELFTATIQANPPSVVLDVEDARQLPQELQRVTVDADRSAISTKLKAGEKLPFAHLEHSESLRIR